LQTSPSATSHFDVSHAPPWDLLVHKITGLNTPCTIELFEKQLQA
jgi:hypothetical protein